MSRWTGRRVLEEWRSVGPGAEDAPPGEGGFEMTPSGEEEDGTKGESPSGEEEDGTKGEWMTAEPRISGEGDEGVSTADSPSAKEPSTDDVPCSRGSSLGRGGATRKEDGTDGVVAVESPLCSKPSLQAMFGSKVNRSNK